jgi:RNA polymerase sigma factor for flagellar operon FliA
MNKRTVSNDDPRLSVILERVRRLAHGVARRVPRHVQVDDLVSAGNLGVAVAMARYPGDDSGLFEAYALAHARGAILDELRRHDHVSRRYRAKAREMQRAERRLSIRLGRRPDDAEIAEEMGIQVDDYVALQRLVAPTLTRLDDEAGEDVAPHEPSADEALHARRVREFLSEEVGRLPERQSAVVALSFGEEQTLATIATAFGVTEGRVCQLRKAALEKLRAACVANDVWLDDVQENA